MKTATSAVADAIKASKDASAEAKTAVKLADEAEQHAKDAKTQANGANAETAKALVASADAAELDASVARSAAAQAEQDAKDADEYAQEAQEAADRAEKAEKAKQINTGTVPDENGHSIGNVFYVVDHIEKVGEPEVTKQTDGCEGFIDKLFYNGDCTMTSKIRYKEVLDLYLCSAEGIDPQKLICPAEATLYLGEVRTDELSQTITHTITIAEFQANVDPVDILFGSWIRCAQLMPGGERGSAGGCAWAALDVASLFAGKIIRPIAEAVKAADAAARTGIGFADAWKALRALPLSEEAIAGIGARALQALGKACGKPRIAALARTVSGEFCWVELGGPGRWFTEKESMKSADAAYQRVVTDGVPEGFVYKVPASTPSGFVKFDGYKNGKLIDAKNLHYPDSFINPSTGKLKFPTAETTTMKKQVAAANGVPVVWYMNNERTATALRLWAIDNDVKGIEFVFRPVPVTG
ncbi:hypothetical protein [Streptomyces sp. NPDC058751]|uniref:hypothetical protein n=1 Tax=Streptomyces sp. NPDC058751 TaxID=3346623 RepID=UPI003693CA37